MNGELRAMRFLSVEVEVDEFADVEKALTVGVEGADFAVAEEVDMSSSECSDRLVPCFQSRDSSCEDREGVGRRAEFEVSMSDVELNGPLGNAERRKFAARLEGRLRSI